jgi:hypothetical protein
MDSIFFVLGVLFASTYTKSVALLLVIVLFGIFEISVKLKLKGLFRYRRSYRNSIDGIITIVLFLILIIERNTGFNYIETLVVKLLVIVRLILYPRNIVASQRFTQFRKKYRLAFEHALLGTGHIVFLLVVLLILMYIFAGLGLQIFGGKICTIGTIGSNISTSYYGLSNYYPLNFNDMLSGLVTMFTLLSVNNMHITTSGFVASLSNRFPQLFFAIWYAVGVLFLLNVLTAYFLKEFIVFKWGKFT